MIADSKIETAYGGYRMNAELVYRHVPRLKPMHARVLTPQVGST